MEQFTGKEEFTMTFTSEEWGMLVLGLQTLQQSMDVAALKSGSLEVLNRAHQTREMSDKIAEKIAAGMGINLDEED